MMRPFLLIFLSSAAFLSGCNLPGRPKPGPEVPRPESVLDFNTLYQQNCAGCHGTDGQHGPATNLANPVYQALVDDATLKDVIANGQHGTLMPAFAVASGGLLTDQQVDVLVRGLRARWAKGDVLAGQNPPPYKATGAGNSAHGQQVYDASCARCHGPNAQQPGPSGSILDGSFLSLIIPQTIRTTVLAGRPDLGMPDYRTLMPNHPLTDADVTDVTAWLIAQRPPAPGQPYPDQQPGSQPPGMPPPNNIQGPVSSKASPANSSRSGNSPAGQANAQRNAETSNKH